ncbi:MAG: glycoside hydrolase family 16 protein [Planctomycetes bacterium]|nr:glycoside hydrolase family 16 protein [Planctomycetota bacterium]
MAIAVLTVFVSAAAPAVEPARDPNLIWHDEFDGEALDETKWSHRGLGPRKDGVNVKEAVRLDGEGHLVITTRAVGGAYHTGMIGTQGKFERALGYFECRVKLQRQRGHWSAFWLQSPRYGQVIGDTGASGTEIDIFEYLRSRGDRVQHTLHWHSLRDEGSRQGGYGKDHKSAGKVAEVRGLGDGWHTIGLEWTEEAYIFYVDGKETWRTKEAISRTPQYIILSLEVGNWAGDIATADLPDSVYFDYVRVYRRRPTRSPSGRSSPSEH